MNKVYRSVWNATTNTWAAAAETAKSRSKGSARAARRAVVALALGGMSMGGAFAAEECTTEDGRKGSLGAAGVCTAASVGTLGTSSVGTSAIGTNAALDDTYIQVKAGQYASATPAQAGDGATAVGANANANALSAVAIGGNSVADYNAVAIGTLANAAGRNAVALGVGANATAANTTALGRAARASATNSVALGTFSNADRDNTVSVGSAGAERQIVNVQDGTKDTDAVNVRQLSTKLDNTYAKIDSGGGAAATANGGASMAIGGGAHSDGANSIALGYTAGAAADRSIAVGSGAAVDAAGTFGVAIGRMASVTSTGTNSVALGQASVADRADTVSVGNATQQRQITNMAAGTADTDAVNVSQLKGTLGTLGGGATVNPDGSIQGPTYNLTNGGPQHTVGDALDALDGGITDINNKLGSVVSNDYVKIDTTNVTAAAQAGGDATAIGANAQGTGGGATAVGNSTIASAPNSSAFGRGAEATDGAATAVGAYAKATGYHSTALGVNATASGAESVALGLNSLADRDNSVAVGNATQKRQIINMAAGTQATDAVNVSQLSPVVDALGGGATINPDGSVTGPTYTVGDGNGGTKVVNNVGDAVTNLDGRVTQNEGDITNIRNELGSGTIGLVQQAGAGADLTVGANTDGAAVNFTGTAGDRKLTGVANGTVSATSKEAVNGSQLHGVSQSVASAIGAGSTVNPDGSISQPSFTVGDGAGGTKVVHNVGDAVTNLDGRVTTNEGAITNIRNEMNNGSIGLVQQSAPGADLTVGAATNGTAVNFGGTAGDRRLTGVANGSADNDAVSIAQMKAMGLWDPNANLPMAAVVYDDITLSSVTFGGTGGTTLKNVFAGEVSATSMDAINGSQLYDLSQRVENYYSGLNDRVSGLEQGGGSGGGSGGGDFSGSGKDSTQVGAGSNASGDRSTAVGSGSNASGENSTAIGQGSSATADNSVAIGQGSTTGDREGTVSVGSAGNERQITNVAEGTAGTDAVNVNQLNRNVANLQGQIDTSRRDAMGGTAAAMAVAGLPQSVMPGRTFMSIAGSTYGGEYGTAIGASYMTKDGKWTVKGAVNTSSRGEVGAVVGGGFYW